MDLGIIGNCQYSALIDREACLRWMCWPRFDSSPIFAALIDEKKGGEFTITTDEKHSVDQHYLRNTNILRTVFRGEKGVFEIIDCAPRFEQYHRTFHPTMLVRIARPLEGHPMIRVRISPTYDYARILPKVYWGSHHIQYDGFPNAVRLTSNAPLTYLEEGRSFALIGPCYFVLTWGEPLEAPLADTCETFVQYTEEYWRHWVKHCAIPSCYQDEVIRSALLLKLHQYEDTGAIIAASTTSLPESPNSGRTWDYRYCWLRDAYFSLSAFRYLGQFEEMEAFVEFLYNIAESTGAYGLQPLYSVSGKAELVEHTLDHLEGYEHNQPVRVGNAAYGHIQNDIYGEMILAMSPLFLDRRFVLDNMEPPKRLLYRLLDHIDRCMEIEDAGIWEFRAKSKLHTFSLLMHWLGARTSHAIAKRYELPEWRKKAEYQEKRARDLIENKCWNEELGAYTQGASSRDLDASLFMMITTGFLPPTHPRAERHLRALEKGLLTQNDLIYRYRHWDDFGIPESTFTICHFWYVEALAKLGHATRAGELFSKYIRHTNHLGLMSEDIDPMTLKQWGNFPQTYSHVGLINAAFQIGKEENGL